MSVSDTSGAGLQLVIHNGTSTALPAVQDTGATTDELTLSPNADNFVPVALGDSRAEQFHLQIFPAGQTFPEVVTIIVSIEDATGSQSAVVGQAFTGGV